jgi:hypothetical protein
MWEVSASTKLLVSKDANAEGPHNVAVFHIVDFHRQRLELGAYASRQLTRQVAEHVRQDFGSAAFVSLIEPTGTVVATLPGNRAEVDKAASELVRRFESTSLRVNGKPAIASPALAYAIVAFQSSVQPLAEELPVPALQSEPATTAAS